MNKKYRLGKGSSQTSMVIKNFSQNNDDRGDMAKIKREDNQHKISLHSASTLTY